MLTWQPQAWEIGHLFGMDVDLGDAVAEVCRPRAERDADIAMATMAASPINISTSRGRPAARG